MSVTYHYRCGCGHTHPAELGKYGCPNCDGETGPAQLRPAPNARRLTLAELQSKYPDLVRVPKEKTL